MTRLIAGVSLVMMLAACEPAGYTYDRVEQPPSTSAGPGIRISGYARAGVSRSW